MIDIQVNIYILTVYSIYEDIKFLYPDRAGQGW